MEPKDLSLKSKITNFYTNRPDATTEYLAGTRIKREPRDVTNADR